MAHSIVHVLHSGGVENTAIASIVERLVLNVSAERFRFSVVFIGADGPLGERLRGAGVEVVAADWSGSWADMRGAFSFAFAVRKAGAEIVQVHSGGRVVRRLAKAAGARFVIAHFHSIEEETLRSRKGRRNVSGADFVVADSAAALATIQSRLPAQVVYPGIDSLPDGQRHESDDQSTVVLGTAARIAPVKGIDVLVDAVKKVRDAGGDIRLEVAGDGPEIDNLRLRAAKNGIADSVRFLGWQTDVSRLMRLWDIYVQPSRQEAFGLAILEAMAAGLPVVATAVGGIPELVVDGETGMLVQADDSVALADKISLLVRSRPLRSKLGSAGRARATECFSADRAARSMCDVYQALLE